MLYLTDELPNFCPSCGKAHSEEWKDANHDDFMAGASGVCECGARYQHLASDKIIEAGRCLGVAQEKGDKDAIAYWATKVDELVTGGGSV